MKIAVSHNLPSGGAKRTLYESLKRLSKSHTVDVYTTSAADHAFCDVRPFARRHEVFPFEPRPLFGPPAGRLNQLQRWRDLRDLDRLARRVASRIEAVDDYDLVFGQPCRFSQAPALLRYLRLPTVYYCHEPPRDIYEAPVPLPNQAADTFHDALDRLDPLIHLYRMKARQVDWVATRAASTVLVNSEFIRNSAASIYEINPIVSYHGTDTDVFRPTPEVDRQGFVLSVGALQPRKGFEFLLHSLNRIPVHRRPALRLVGNAEFPGERQHLEAMATELRVQLHIEVGVDQNTLVRRYNQASLVIYAPHAEPFGLVPLEAMACGTPVVGVAEGGVLESVVHEQTGLLETRDPDRFAEAIQRLLNDPRLRDIYGRQGRDLVLERWSWTAAVERLEQHLRAAIRTQPMSIVGQYEVGAHHMTPLPAIRRKLRTTHTR